MKKLFLTIFTFTLTLSSFCQTSSDLDTELRSISNQLSIDGSSFQSTNSQSRPINADELRFIESKKDLFLNFQLDLENAVAYIIRNANGITITSISIPYLNSDKILNYVYEGSDYLLQNLTVNYNDRSQKLFINLANTIETTSAGRWASWSAWNGCMTNFFGSGVGTFVNIMGIAGGVGCVACGAVAGAVTGVMMIACTQAY